MADSVDLVRADSEVPIRWCSAHRFMALPSQEFCERSMAAADCDIEDGYWHAADEETITVTADRLQPYHIVTITEESWVMAHPLSCDLTECEFMAVAITWTEPPPLGVFHWGPSLDDTTIEALGETRA